jgi:hypothetical protein
MRRWRVLGWSSSRRNSITAASVASWKGSLVAKVAGAIERQTEFGKWVDLGRRNVAEMDLGVEVDLGWPSRVIVV